MKLITVLVGDFAAVVVGNSYWESKFFDSFGVEFSNEVKDIIEKSIEHIKRNNI